MPNALKGSMRQHMTMRIAQPQIIARLAKVFFFMCLSQRAVELSVAFLVTIGNPHLHLLYIIFANSVLASELP